MGTYSYLLDKARAGKAGNVVQLFRYRKAARPPNAIVFRRGEQGDNPCSLCEEHFDPVVPGFGLASADTGDVVCPNCACQIDADLVNIVTLGRMWVEHGAGK